MSSSDIVITGDLKENLIEEKPQQESRKRKMSDPASDSPDEQGGERKPKAAKIEEVKEEELEKEEDDDEMDKEDEYVVDEGASEEDAGNEDEEDEEEKTYDVEKIIGHKKENGEVLYHVKWEGFDDSENTFEPVSNLHSVSYMVEAYKKSLSEEDRQELEGKKKSKTSISPTKKAVTPSAKTRNTPKTTKKVKEEEPEDDDDEEMDEENEEVGDEGASEEDAEDEDKEEEEEKTYDVEKIIGHKKEKGEVLYHVKWEGFDDSENTFEPVSNLHSVSHMIDAYKESLSEEARQELEGKKKSKRNISQVKKAATPSAKVKSTPKTAKSKSDDQDNVAVVKTPVGSSTPASTKRSRGRPPANTKSIADFFKAKTPARGKRNDEKESKNTPASTEEKLKKIIENRAKATELAEGDEIGVVAQKASDVLITLLQTNADPEKLHASVKDLKAERERVEELDKKAGKPRGSDKKREEIYMLAEALEKSMGWYADREKKLRNPEMKEELKEEPKVEETASSSDPLVACDVTSVSGEKDKSVAAIQKIEIKDEDSDVDQEMDEEACPSPKTTNSTPAAAKTTGTERKNTVSPKKSEGPKTKIASMFTPFKCKVCPEVFASKRELAAHGWINEHLQ